MILNDAEDIKFGDTDIDYVYLGDEEIWSRSKPYVPISDVTLSNTNLSLYNSFGGYLPQGSTSTYKIEMAVTTTATEEQSFAALPRANQALEAWFDSELHLCIVRGGNATATTYQHQINDECIVTIIFGSSTASITGPYGVSATAAGGYLTILNYGTLALFGYGNRYFKGRCRYVKVWVDDVLKVTLQPSKRVADDAVGLYDTMNDVFYQTSVGE